MTGTAPSRPLEFESLESEEQLRRSREFLQRMRRRRTVRDFSSRPVPYELIENAIRVAGSAPSGANQQPWTFVAISDPGTKRRIRIAAEAEERVNYESRMSDEWLAALEPLGTTWRKPFLEVVPWIIVVFRQSYGLSIHPETGVARRFTHLYSEESVGIVCSVRNHMPAVESGNQILSPGDIVLMTCGQLESERVAEPVNAYMDLRAEPAPAATKGLCLLSSGFFDAPAAQGWALTIVLSMMRCSMSGSSTRC